MADQLVKYLVPATVYIIIDFIVSSLLYAHLVHFSNQLTLDVSFYQFSTSTLELWLLSTARFSVTLGCIIGITVNRTQESIQRIKTVFPLFLTFGAASSILAIIKLLCYSEVDKGLDFDHDAWFWAIFGWTAGASFCFSIILFSFGRIKLKSPRESLCTNGSTENLCSADDSNSSRKNFPQKRSSVLRLISYSKPEAHLLLVAFFFMVISSVSEIFTPYYTGKVIQAIAIERSHEKFVHAIINMSLFAGASSVAAGIRGGFFRIAMSRLNIRIRNHLFSAVIRQEVGFFDVTRTGDITSRLTSDTTTMSDALSLNFNVFLRSVIKMIGICVFMFRLSWRLSMVTVIGLPIIMLVSKLNGKYYETLSKRIQDSLARVNEIAEEVCSSIRTVRSFANEAGESLRYADKLHVTYGLKVREAYVYAAYVWTTQLFSLSLVIATLVYGGHLVIEDMLSGGDLVSFILYQMELGSALQAIADVYTGLMSAVGASDKVFEYIDRIPRVPTDGFLAPDKLDGRIEFRNVTFAYPSRPDSVVLRNVSFTISPGEVVALVGPSGSGKSSCVNLIEHFYNTASGQVLIDGVNVASFDHSYLHQKVALVGQEPVLYARSLRENISYGLALDPQVEQDIVTNAAQLSNAHEFITQLSTGYDTDVGEKGAQLSGGQKQRVAIARALVRNPTVLLLDEATSALDSESEHLVQEAIYSNRAGRSILIIAHRLSTVERADRVLVMSGGEIVEQGSHSELIQRSSGLYSKLVRRQMLVTDIRDVSDIKPMDDSGWEERSGEGRLCNGGIVALRSEDALCNGGIHVSRSAGIHVPGSERPAYDKLVDFRISPSSIGARTPTPKSLVGTPEI